MPQTHLLHLRMRRLRNSHKNVKSVIRPIRPLLKVLSLSPHPVLPERCHRHKKDLQKKEIRLQLHLFLLKAALKPSYGQLHITLPDAHAHQEHSLSG